MANDQTLAEYRRLAEAYFSLTAQVATLMRQERDAWVKMSAFCDGRLTPAEWEPIDEEVRQKYLGKTGEHL